MVQHRLGRTVGGDSPERPYRRSRSRFRGIPALFAASLLAGMLAVLSAPAVAGAASTPTFTYKVTQKTVTPIAQLTAVSCANASDCVAVGSYTSFGPSILVTANGGTQWTRHTGPSAVGLPTGVSCPSTSDCYVTGGSGIAGVLVTTNSGTTWSKQNLPTTTPRLFGLNAISCHSTTHCVAVGAEGTSPTGSLAAVSTASGGAAWTAGTITTPSGTTGSLDGVSCSSTTDCIAVGSTRTSTTSTGVAYSTTDGGSTWTKETLPTGVPQLIAVTCPSTTDCVAVGPDLVVTTTDGGASWTLHALTLSATLDAVSCPSTADCVAVGSVITTSGSPADETALSSTNGGATWTTATSLPTLKGSLHGVSCSATTACEAVGNSTVNTFGDGRGNVLVTSNRTTWTDQTVPVTGHGALQDVSCRTAAHCVAVTGFEIGAVEVSTDGGSTWTLKALPPQVGVVQAVSCPSTTVCFATTYAGLAKVLKTTDGGTSWTIQTIPSGLIGLYSVSCPSTTVCVAVGGTNTNQLAAIHTTNGGTTWTSGSVTTPTGTIGFLGGVSCSSTSDCIAVGSAGSSSSNSGLVFATTDGGAAWTEESLSAISPSVTTLTSVSCPLATHCIAVGRSAILATTNGGTQWSAETLPTGTGALTAVSCASATVCTALAGYSPDGLVATTDGGSTWTTQAIPSTVPFLSGISCPTTTSCIAGGGGTGTIGFQVIVGKVLHLPAQPTGVSAVPGTAKVTISWSSASNATSYAVYDATTSGAEAYSGTPACTATAPTTTCTVTGLTNGTTYFFTVEAVDATGSSAPSTEVHATPNTALSAPPSLHAEAASTSAVISWTGVATASGYAVYDSTTTGGEIYTAPPACTSGSGSGRGTNFCTVGGLTSGTTYYFTVETTHTGVRSTPSSPVSAEPVAAPIDVTESADSIAVVIHYAPGTTTVTPQGYDVYEGTTTGGETYTTPVSGCAGVNTNTCTVTGVTDGATYYFTVKAFGPTYLTTPSIQVKATPLAGPGTVKAAPGNGRASVSWSSVKGATSYHVYDAATPGQENYSGTPACTATAPTTTCTVTGLTNGTTEYFTVESFNGSGHSTPSSEVSATPVATTSSGGGGGGSGSSTLPPPGPQPGEATTKSGTSSTSNGTLSLTDKTVGLKATLKGAGAVTIGGYSGNPTSLTLSTSTGKYLDVELSTGSTFTSLTLTVCSVGTGSWLDWWNGTSWVPFSTATSGATGCIIATVTKTTTPDLAQLTGTPITVVRTSTRIYGQTADATAAAELGRVFPHSSTATCAGGSAHAVVLARDSGYQDALSSQDLAQHLSTGTLLTPTETVSKSTLTALRVEGIQHVYVVGGPLAVSDTVVNQLQKTPAYDCGGTTVATKATGAQMDLSVTRIFGQSAAGTAEAVAEFVASAPSLTFSGAYSGTNATGGRGRFNDTAGNGSSAPSQALPTAILATGATWMDAESASALSYSDGIPILLTTPTSLPATSVAALKALGVKQVVVMGGPLAVSDAVVNELETTLGIVVLRIAGKDYTDTSTELATFELSPAGTGAGWTPASTSLLVARGNGFTDGLAGAVLERIGVTSQTPLVLTESPTALGAYLTAFLKAAGRTGAGIGTSHRKLLSLTVLGGPLAVTTALVFQMRTDLQH